MGRRCRPSFVDAKARRRSPRWRSMPMGISMGTFSGRKSARIAPFGPWSLVCGRRVGLITEMATKDNRLENLRLSDTGAKQQESKAERGEHVRLQGR